MTLQEIANKLGKTKCSVKMALQRLAKKQEALAGVSREKRGTNQHCQPYRQTKEGIKITEFEHRFAKLYAKGEHNLAQMAEALGVKLQAIHDARYKLRGKLGIQDDIEFNYALRAIAEL
jgi:predicted transcriptional regulator